MPLFPIFPRSHFLAMVGLTIATSCAERGKNERKKRKNELKISGKKLSRELGGGWACNSRNRHLRIIFLKSWNCNKNIKFNVSTCGATNKKNSSSFFAFLFFIFRQNIKILFYYIFYDILLLYIFHCIIKESFLDAAGRTNEKENFHLLRVCMWHQDKLKLLLEGSKSCRKSWTQLRMCYGEYFWCLNGVCSWLLKSHRNTLKNEFFFLFDGVCW